MGIFDNSSRSGGSSPFFEEGESDFPAWINLNSALVIELLSCGSFVTRLTHVVSQRSPREAKRMNGPDIPIEVINNGVSTKPTTFPRWKPPMDIPIAVARSWHGNHLHNWKHIQTQLPLKLQEKILSNIIIGFCNFGISSYSQHFQYLWVFSICHKSKMRRLQITTEVVRCLGYNEKFKLPGQKSVHGRQSYSFSKTKESTNGQETDCGVICCPWSEESGQRPKSCTPSNHFLSSIFVN